MRNTLAYLLGTLMLLSPALLWATTQPALGDTVPNAVTNSGGSSSSQSLTIPQQNQIPAKNAIPAENAVPNKNAIPPVNSIPAPNKIPGPNAIPPTTTIVPPN